MANEKSFTVFYCWQSDLKNASNRSFIGEALESAIEELNQDDSVNLEVEIDRDTLNVPGAPDINTAILSKIDQSHAFVADVSIIRHDDPRVTPSPNPNVLLELGYALRSMGGERIVLVMNTAFGGPDRLPFDLNHRRVLPYNSPDEAIERAPERKELRRNLLKALRSIMDSHPRFPIDPGDPILSEEALQILQHAVVGDGLVLVVSNMGGSFHIQSGDLSLSFGNRREGSKFELAVDRLIEFGFLKSTGGNGNVFKLTASGFQYWEKLSRK